MLERHSRTCSAIWKPATRTARLRRSLGGLLAQGPVTPALAHLVTDTRGFGWLPE